MAAKDVERSSSGVAVIGWGHRVAAASVALVTLLTCLLVLPFGRISLGAVAPFLPAFGSVVFVTDFLTAALLFSQARLDHERAIVALGSAYLFSATAVIPHLLCFPDLFGPQPVIGSSASAVWLWCVWHGGFALAVCRFVHAGGRVYVERMVPRAVVTEAAVVVATVTALAVLATAGLPWLPVILQSAQFNRLNTLGIGPAILGIHLVVLTLLVRRPMHSPLSLWLTVAMLAASLDVLLTLSGGGRFTLSWYVGRLLSLMTGLTVLVALLADLMSQSARVAQLNKQLEHLLGVDVLTEVANRRAFDQALQIEWRRARREGSLLSLVMIDIDCFKGYNDRYGHRAGDICLHAVATAVKTTLQRPADLAARLGGEEFALLLPNTERQGAAELSERVRAAVAALEIPHALSPSGVVTISLGVAECDPSGQAIDGAAALEAADRALYEAKSSGRNRVCVAPAAPLPELVFAAAGG